MLKIKDNVGLKELEKYGFKLMEFHYKKIYGKKEKYIVGVPIYGPFYGKIIFYKKNQGSYYPFKEKKRLIKDLIQAGFVEKI